MDRFRRIAAFSCLGFFAIPALSVRAEDAQKPGEQPAPAEGILPPVVESPRGSGPVMPVMAPVASDAASAPTYPLAGYHGGLFYLRDDSDNFRLYVQGRAQIDNYNYFGPGVPDTKLRSTIFLKRIRPEITGEFLKIWQFNLAGDWAATAVDNTAGTVLNSAGATPSYSEAQTVGSRAIPTDVWLNFRPDRAFNIQIGQFDAPFTMENRTSDKFIPFMERSLAVRAFGIPTNKEMGVMVWGETADRLFFYSIGGFNGDGQNRGNVDGRADLIGRVFTHPIQEGVLKGAQIGVSFRYGSRDTSLVNYDYSKMTTQANYAFWSPSYKDLSGKTVRILPSGLQEGLAGELRIPVADWDLTSEFVYIKNGTREANDGLVNTQILRRGEMKGYSYYVQVGYWPLGNRDVNGMPGYENPSHVDLAKKDPVEPKQALQLLAKWEQLSATYASNTRGGNVDTNNVDGDIKINAFSLGVNYWATKHVRLSLNYVMNMFPDSEPTKPATKGGPGPVWSSSQRALAPGNTLAAGVNNDARDNAHSLNEVTTRVAVAF